MPAFQRKCDECGKTYLASRKTSKFCGATCRVNAGRAKAPAIGVVAQQAEAESGLAGVVRRTLEKVDRLDTVLGQYALVLAKGASSFETGSAAAARSRELDRILDKVLEDVQVAGDELDELRARRDAKLNAG